jgi:hypothetical protein
MVFGLISFFEPGKQQGKPPLLDFIRTQKQKLSQTNGKHFS